MQRRQSRAFTLVELLVVIAIIGILVALLLPAVQAARSVARRLRCQNNLKQLSLAVLNYVDNYESFPPSSHWPNAGADIQQKNNPALAENWVIMILPFMEQQSLYDEFDLTKYITHADNQTARGRKLPTMLCPTDIFNSKPFNGNAKSGTNNLNDGWARGNYGANAGLGFMTSTATGNHGGYLQGAGDAALPESIGWKDRRTRGVMGANSSVTVADIRDGTSNTIMLGELRAGVVEFDVRGIWAMSGGCPSSLWAHGYLGDANGPNTSSMGADDILICDEVRAAVGGGAKLAEMGMPCPSGSRPNYQQTMRSLHTDGVFVSFCDGSVQFVSIWVEVSTSHSYRSIWDRLNLSADGDVLPAESW